MPWLLSILLALPGTALADPYQEGYRRGFQDGYQAGQRAAQQGSYAPSGAASAGGSGGGGHGIIVMRAAYGDGRHECEYTGPLAGRVNGRVSASLEVSNSLCGDPAPGQRKSLKVEYTCGGAVKQASALEHRTLYLSCQ